MGKKLRTAGVRHVVCWRSEVENRKTFLFVTFLCISGVYMYVFCSVSMYSHSVLRLYVPLFIYISSYDSCYVFCYAFLFLTVTLTLHFHIKHTNLFIHLSSTPKRTYIDLEIHTYLNTPEHTHMLENTWRNGESKLQGSLVGGGGGSCFVASKRPMTINVHICTCVYENMNVCLYVCMCIYIIA